MKSFDLFQKVTVDNSSRPTCIGALISLTAISIMTYILFKQLNEYFFIPLIKKDSIIFQDYDQVSTVPVNIGITFPNMPCPIISVDQEDLLGHHKLNIHDTLNKIHLDSAGKPLNTHFDARDTEKLLGSIKDKQGCFLQGNVPISKVQGDIHISFHAYRDVYSFLQQNGHDDKISLAHHFSLLNFGDTNYSSKFLDKFGLHEQYDNFNKIGSLPNFDTVSWDSNFDYYVKIVPQIYEDEYTDEKFTAYQYSLTGKTRKMETGHNHSAMPIIMINYDYSPVGVKYTMKKRYFSHLITNICALVGGVFVIFSILNGLINSFIDFIDDDSGKISKSIN